MSLGPGGSQDEDAGRKLPEEKLSGVSNNYTVAMAHSA